MLIQNRPNLLVGIAFSLFLSGSSAATLDSQKKALDIILDFAEKICHTAPPAGTAENIELSGKAKVELSDLLKKIADLGIEGAAKYQQSEYQGVLQKDLAPLLLEGSKCRQEVWKDLKDKLLVGVAPDYQPKPKPPSGISGAAYTVRAEDRQERNTFDAIIQFTSPKRARWRYTNSPDWNETLELDSLSPHKVLLAIGANDPSRTIWDLEFSDDFREVSGSFRFLQTSPGNPRWRNYTVQGSRIE